MDDISATLSADQAKKLSNKLVVQLESKIFGQQVLIEEAIATLLVSGHILLTGAPGLAKTTLVREIASSIGLEFGRIQFTPDLMPSDIIGSDILNIDDETGKRKFEFQKGPVFTNLLLADEINRASPRTQAALLEAMQEKTVTNSGVVYNLSETFMVFATQNPLDSEGTFPLPEAQLDRFLMSSIVTYPGRDDELKILSSHSNNNLVGSKKNKSQSVIEYVDLVNLTNYCKQIPFTDELLSAANDLVRSTRPEDETCPATLKHAIDYGASPRGGLALVSAAKAFAALDGSSEVRWRHVKRVAIPCLRHRVKLGFGAHRDGVGIDSVLEELIENVEKKKVSLGQV